MSDQTESLTEPLLAATADTTEDESVRTLDEIDDLLEGVSPGPWEFWPGVHGDPLVAQVGRGPFGAITMCNTSPPGDTHGFDGGFTDYGRANAIFIAATRTVVPQLTDMVRERDARIAELEQQLADSRTKQAAYRRAALEGQVTENMSEIEKHLLIGHGLRYEWDSAGPCSDSPEAVHRMAHWPRMNPDHTHNHEARPTTETS